MRARFTRNRRQRILESMAEEENLRLSHQMDKGLISNLGERLRREEHFREHITEIVGRESIAAGEPTFLIPIPSTDTNPVDRYQYIPRQEAGSVSSYSEQYVTPETIKIETLRLLHIKSIRDSLRSQVHFHVGLADKEVGYSISDSALVGMSSNQLYKVIASEISRVLIARIKGK